MNRLSFTSPGRINLLGEHIDYNGGIVLPACIEQGIHFEVFPNDQGRFIAESLDLQEKCHISPANAQDHTWLRYWLAALENVPAPSQEKGYTFQIQSNLPIGAGLSSSSALTCGFIHAINQLYNLSLTPAQLIQWAVTAEHGTGVKGGAMDQSVIFLGKKEHLLQLDTSTHEHEHIPWFFTEQELFLINSNAPHSLADSAYNERRACCEKAVELWNQHHGHIQFLTELNLNDLQKLHPHFSTQERGMLGYVIEEQHRVQTLLKALSTKDATTIGQLMSATHQGLSQKYLVSTPYIDSIQALVDQDPRVKGARMIGGGFGGCILVLAEKNQASSIFDQVAQKINSEFSTRISHLPVQLSQGLLN